MSATLKIFLSVCTVITLGFAVWCLNPGCQKSLPLYSREFSPSSLEDTVSWAEHELKDPEEREYPALVGEKVSWDLPVISKWETVLFTKQRFGRVFLMQTDGMCFKAGLHADAGTIRSLKVGDLARLRAEIKRISLVRGTLTIHLRNSRIVP